MSENLRENYDEDSASPEYFYAVLNLPTTASGEELRDRYRHLSLIFHPDKQQNEHLKETATKKFLEVQKAYEVLSDSTLRQAYDSYGLQGIKLVTKSELNGIPPLEIQVELARRKAHQEYLHTQQVLLSTGRVTVAVDATSLSQGWDSDIPVYERILSKAKAIQISSVDVRNTFKKTIGNHTTLTGSSRAIVGVRTGHKAVLGSTITGSVTHQLSPFLAVSGSTSFLQKPNLTLGAAYGDGDNEMNVEAYFAPLFATLASRSARPRQHSPFEFLPHLSLQCSRRLFPGSQMWGRIAVTTSSSVPILSIAISAGESTDSEEPGSDRARRSPSLTGLSSQHCQWTMGIKLLGVLPILFAECGLIFRELGLRLQTGLELGASLSAVLGATWISEQQNADAGLTSLSAQVAVGLAEISLKLKLVYYNQVIHLPIVVSAEFSSVAAFWTTVVPSTSAVLAYYFILKPRQRGRRVEFFRQARRDLREAKADKVRPVEETVALLRDMAKRQMRAEASTDGLVITDAKYGPSERDDAAKGLDIDVTIPIQVLVNNSQLYIPGRRSKAALQGFYDPAPSISKSLRVHYTFRGRPHYAETPDHMPLALPLAEHLVE